MAMVLNVDDNPATRYARSRVLRQSGFDVIEAGTGADALAIARAENPHLVLLDVRLPDISGIEVCRSIKTDPLTMRTPVVQISATFVTERDKELGLEGGAEIYLTEPVEPQELITVVRMLLRLRSVERTLSEAETRWRRLFAANVIGIVIVEGTRVLEANDAFLGTIGKERAQFRPQLIDLASITPAEFSTPDAIALEELRATGTCATYEKELLRPDGTRVRVLHGGAVLSNSEVTRWMGFVLDISERRRAEAEREELLRRERAARWEAERATRIRDEFLANLSHELRTPMSTITGWLHLLRSGRLSKEEASHGIEAIERATRAQNQLIEDLLDVSRIVAGKLDIDRERVSLSKVVEASVESVALAAKAKHITISRYPLDGDVAVRGDPRRLQQVFWNLLTNAVKFTPPGGAISVSIETDGATVRVAVSDTGEGIAPEFLPYVFERFRQADGSTSRKHSGMGLGLAIVRHVIDLHGGSIVAHSEGAGQGATFIVELPCAAGGAEATPLPPESGVERPLEGIEVLLVEDDDDAREVATAILAQSGAQCRAVASAAEALAVLDAWVPEVVVSDIGMAGVDGYAFVSRLRALNEQRGQQVPAIALTAFARQADRNRALESGYVAHVPKPIHPPELVRAILEATNTSVRDAALGGA